MSSRPVATALLNLVVAIGAGQVLLGAPQSPIVVDRFTFQVDAVVGVPYLQSICSPPLPAPGEYCGAPTPATNPHGGTPPYQFRHDTLGAPMPPGLTLYPNGVIGGTPTTPGTYAFRVVVMDKAGQTATITMTIPVSPRRDEPQKSDLIFRTGRLPNGSVGVYYFESLCLPRPSGPTALCGLEGATNPTGGKPPYSFQLDTFGNFPPFGLTLNLNGTITGTPTAEGEREFRVCVHDLTGTYACGPVQIYIGPKEEKKEQDEQAAAAGKPKKGMDPVTLAAIGGGAALAGLLLANQLGQTEDACLSRPTCNPLTASPSTREACIAEWDRYCKSCGFSYFDRYVGSCK